MPDAERAEARGDGQLRREALNSWTTPRSEKPRRRAPAREPTSAARADRWHGWISGTPAATEERHFFGRAIFPGRKND